MADLTTQLMDFTLVFLEADKAWTEWIVWVLESAGYTIEQQKSQSITTIYESSVENNHDGQHLIMIYSEQFSRSKLPALMRLQEMFLSNADRRVLPILVEPCDVNALVGAVLPVSLIDCDRTLAQQKLLEAARSLPLPFNPPPQPPFRKTQPPFPCQIQGLSLIKRRGQAQGYIEKLEDLLQLEMMQIPGGTFMMGAPESEEGSPDRERPIHQVTVAQFFMGRYPVTQAQWRFIAELPQIGRALDPDPSDFKGDNRPVEQVSSIDAIEFCERLSKFTGRSYRLPSEAEWEYACRAGTTTPFHFGETIDARVANYAAHGNLMGSGQYGRGQLGEDRQQTIDVGSLNAPNAFGLHDMHGNVTQWCMDNWHITYDGAPNDGSVWLQSNPENHHSRIRRGGSWKANARGCRSAFRSPAGVGFRSNHLGFRIVFSTV